MLAFGRTLIYVVEIEIEIEMTKMVYTKPPSNVQLETGQSWMPERR